MIQQPDGSGFACMFSIALIVMIMKSECYWQQLSKCAPRTLSYILLSFQIDIFVMGK